MPTGRSNQFAGNVGGPISERIRRFSSPITKDSAKEGPAHCPAGGCSERCHAPVADFAEISRAGFDASGKCNDVDGQFWDPCSGVFDADAGGPGDLPGSFPSTTWQAAKAQAIPN